jgi:hypothetical protein
MPDPLFDTKIAIVVRADLAVWQKLNVTAFLTSGIVAAKPHLIGEPYEDASGATYSPMLIQPVLVFAAEHEQMKTVYSRLRERECKFGIYTEALFRTGNDVDNRAAVRAVKSEDLTLVGLAFREERRIVDKIVKGLKLHP